MSQSSAAGQVVHADLQEEILDEQVSNVITDVETRNSEGEPKAELSLDVPPLPSSTLPDPSGLEDKVVTVQETPIDQSTSEVENQGIETAPTASDSQSHGSGAPKRGLFGSDGARDSVPVSGPEHYVFEEDESNDGPLNHFTTFFERLRFDGAGEGSLYSRLSAEAEPEYPLRQEWGVTQHRIPAENPFRKGVEQFYRILALILYPFAVLVHEGVRFFGTVVIYFFVRPMTVFSELVLKPFVQTVFMLSMPLWKILYAMSTPIFLLLRMILFEFGKCCSGVLASWRSGNADRFGYVDEELGTWNEVVVAEPLDGMGASHDHGVGISPNYVADQTVGN